MDRHEEAELHERFQTTAAYADAFAAWLEEEDEG